MMMMIMTSSFRHQKKQTNFDSSTFVPLYVQSNALCEISRNILLFTKMEMESSDYITTSGRYAYEESIPCFKCSIVKERRYFRDSMKVCLSLLLMINSMCISCIIHEKVTLFELSESLSMEV